MTTVAAVPALAAFAPLRALSAAPPFENPALPVATRVDDLIGRLSLSEKVSQLTNTSAAIPRFGIPAYDWWSEALHGVARAGIATVYPQAIGLAATWDRDLLQRVAGTIATEGRAKYRDAASRGERGTNHGLTFWAPNINLVRDPRWGRGQETYGEDPFLTSQMGVAFVRGLQGDDPRYLKAAACAKHFAVHSGPEPLRDKFDAVVDATALNDFYLVAFRALVREGRVAGVMSAYSAVNGTPCSVNALLLQRKLRQTWGFDGYVTSDCGAIDNLVDQFKIAPDYAHAAAMAVRAGVDVSCGDTFSNLGTALAEGLVTEGDIDAALRHLLTIRFRLGMFDPPSRVPYASIGMDENDTSTHAALALDAARASIVLLKNDGVLPLSPDVARIAVIGPNADSVDVLLGDYNGTPSHPVTVLAGLRARVPRADVQYARGCDYVLPGVEDDASRALAIARGADVIIFVGGISPRLEGEETKFAVDGFLGGDRTRIELPLVQTALLAQLHTLGKPVVYVQLSGSAIATVWEAANLPAIVQAWYPGEAGGTAVAEVLFGDANPAGRLPVTFYRATSDLPPFVDYAPAHRTYRYFAGTPLYAFGHGLSYTRFAYADLALTQDATNALVRARFKLANVGPRDGDEVVQCYVRAPKPGLGAPLRQLCAFERVHMTKGRSLDVTLEIPLEVFARWDERAQQFAMPRGTYAFEIGASSADIRLTATLELA